MFQNSQNYIYGGQPFAVQDASGIRGVLIRSEKTYLLRVYEPDGQFTDYEIKHDELEVTIAQNSLASFYTKGNHHIIDHSPGVLGLKRSEQ